ncbi:Gfo/Idh/MocA family protein [Antarcticirhabdus aurantiaca]|uniref:Gfo/Idh/MocA family protein n=1 Tax=Antarcticirhabdus aurantiaca TaxID=2606717 RepID=UPI00131E82DC|nr:Gfo/Idh/MocA family oxidoreductase [Antarcticirhabdus aurantiaca]
MAHDQPVRLGIAGLGRGFMLMLPTFAHHPGVEVVAAAAPQAISRTRFEAVFPGSRAYSSVEALCEDPRVEAVYVATPHQMHLEHALLAMRAGKHVMVEKPMALSLDECRAMNDAAQAAGVHLLVGHSHGFDRPYLRTRELVASGEFGRVRMINALNFTDYLYRPRRPEELDTSRGGGVLFSQAPHQIDVARLLAGSEIRSVRASTGIWDAARPTEGAYLAFLQFEDGTCASLTYSGYAHFDTDEWNDWIGEMGVQRDPRRYGQARALLRTVTSPEEEAALKGKRTFASSGPEASRIPDLAGYNHFGLFLVSCDRADLRPKPTGVEIYADEERRFEALPPVGVPRAEVLDELRDALRGGEPIHTGRSATMTVAAFLALQMSAEQGREVFIEELLGA